MKLIVNPHKIEIDKEPVNEREINISKCYFEFADEITSEYVKEAYFTFEDTTYKQIIVNNECDFPSEVLVKKGTVEIGVVAYLVENETEIKRYNPSPVYFNTWQGSLKDDYENSEPITPSDKEQIEQAITNLQNDVDDLEENKQDMLVSGENIKTINGESLLGEGDIKIDQDFVKDNDYVHTDNNYTDAEKEKLANLENYDDTGIKNDISDIKDEQRTQNGDILQNKADIEALSESLTNYSLITETGSQIVLNVNSSNYQMTAILKDKNGNVIYTSNVIDLPIESMIINATYDSDTKEIVFTLQNGNTLRVSVADLVSGLQTEITSENMLSADLVDDTNTTHKFTSSGEKSTWNAKYDKPSGGIPKTDLSSSVQASLGKADTALQEHQDLTDYVKNTDYATSSKGGVIKQYVSTNFLLNTNGHPYTPQRTYENYQNDAVNSFISKGTLENVITGKELVNQTTLDNSQAEQDINISALQNLVTQLPRVSGTGTDIELNPSLNYKLMKSVLKGNSSQESTTGKNLLNMNNFENNGTGRTTFTADENSITITTTSSGTYRYVLNTINNLTIGETYAFSFGAYQDGSNGLAQFGIVNSQGNYYNYSKYLTETQQMTFTPTETSVTVRIGYLSSNVGQNISLKVNNIQLEKSSSATSYEPYTSGTPAPSPSHPFPVKAVTGENSLKLQNANLFSNNITIIYNGTGLTLTRNISEFTVNGTNTNTELRFVGAWNNKQPTFKMPVGTYRLYAYLNNNSISTEVIVGDGTNTNTSTNSNFIITDTYSGISTIKVTVPASTYNNANLQLLLIKSSETNTDYVLHQEQNYSISLGNIELCKIGNYQDYIYKSGDNWYKKGYIGKVVLNGSESDWGSYAATNPGYYVFRMYNNIFSNAIPNSPAFCSHFWLSTNSPGTISANDNSFRITEYSSVQRFYCNTNLVNNVDDFKIWLSTHNVTVYYVLATPTDIPITDTTLIEQLNNIYNNAYSYNGTTNITTTYASGNEQMVIEASALMDLNSLVTRIETLESEV